MIKNFQVAISSDELSKVLDDSAKYHKEKQLAYEGQIKIYSEQPTGTSFDTGESLNRKAQDHRRKFDFFDFAAKHIIPDEMYELSYTDLTQIEIVRY